MHAKDDPEHYRFDRASGTLGLTHSEYMAALDKVLVGKAKTEHLSGLIGTEEARKKMREAEAKFRRQRQGMAQLKRIADKG